MLSILYGGEATDITKQSHMNHFESLWIAIKLSQDFDTEIHLLFTLRTSSFLPTAHRFTCSLTTPCFPPFTAQPHTTWQLLLTYKLQHLHLSAQLYCLFLLHFWPSLCSFTCCFLTDYAEHSSYTHYCGFSKNCKLGWSLPGT